MSAVLQSLPLAVFGKDIKNDFQMSIWNKSAEQLFGIKAQDIIGKKERDLFPKEQTDFFRAKDIEATQSVGVIDIPEEPIQTPKGTVLLHTQKTVVQDENGEPSILLGISEDITARKIIEAEKAKALNLLQQISLRVPGVVYQYLLRADGSSCFPYASEAIRQIYRVSPEEVREDASKVFATLHPDDYNAIVASIQKSARDLTEWHHEYRVKFEDGTVNWLLGKALPLRNNDGSTLWHGFITDISDRKKTEETLRESEEKYRILVNSVLDYAIFMITPEGLVNSWNAGAEHLTGYSADEIIGKSVAKFYPPEFRNTGVPEKELQHARDVGRDEQEGWRVRKDGSRYWANIIITPILDKNGKLRGFIKIKRDISQRKEIENMKERLLEQEKNARVLAETANRVKDEFLATLSHELRTPLTTILSWAQLLRRGQLDAEKTKHGLEVLEQSAKAQGQLIDDLLDISRIQAGKLNLTIQEIIPNEIISAAVDSTRNLAASKSIQIEVSIAPAVKNLFADPVRLQQILWNLITNAIKFSPKGGTIWIQLDKIQSPNGERLRIQVRDSGKGIKADFIPVIFDRFTQVDSSTTRFYGGLGLGLAIVKKLVEMHEGTVIVESPGENKGTTFTVLLPASKQISEINSVEIEPKSKSMGNLSLKGLRVLLVEDDISSREVFAIMLKHFNADVKTAESASEGLALFKEFKPDVLVSDIAMPIEDGYSLIKKVRALGSKLGKTPALALTAYAGQEDIQRMHIAGFQSHLAKPVDAKNLARTIAALAGRT